ncbi:hypothetical protein AB1N83_003334 [Pleurotus pulmonarius]
MPCFGTNFLICQGLDPDSSGVASLVESSAVRCLLSAVIICLGAATRPRVSTSTGCPIDPDGTNVATALTTYTYIRTNFVSPPTVAPTSYSRCDRNGLTIVHFFGPPRCNCIRMRIDPMAPLG